MLASAMAMYNVTFFASFLAIVLKGKYGVADSDMGFYFVILSIPYLFAALAFPFIFSKFPRKLLFVLCFLFSSLAIGMMGPSKILGMPDKSMPLMLIGMFLLGFMQAFCFIPTIPEIMDVIQLKYKIILGYDEDFDAKLNDSISSLYNLFYCLSSLIGPILGGLMYDHLGYESTMDLNMIFIFLIFIGYAVFNCGLNVQSEDINQKKLLKMLKD